MISANKSSNVRLIELPLKMILTDILREELEYRLNFIPQINSFSIEQDTVKLSVASQVTEDYVRSYVENILEVVSSDKRKTKQKIIITTNNDKPIYKNNIFAEMEADRQLKQYTNGIVSCAGIISKLLEYFDEQFRSIGQIFDAQEHTYPTLMPVEILDKCNYFNSFPQFVNFMTHLNEDPDLYQSFTQHVKDGAVDIEQEGLWNNPKFVLSPAVCYHCYDYFKNNVLSSPDGMAVTAKGKCFRFESKNMKTMERLWDFTMREIIFIGTTDFVSQQRKECMCKVIDLVNDLNLCGHVEVANDPFFCDGAEDKRTFQRGFELKYELRLSLPYEKKTLAVASFNIHDDFFAKTFNIRGKKGQEINTGCVAFGLERWVYAFLSQYGLSMDQWPKPVADFCRH